MKVKDLPDGSIEFYDSSGILYVMVLGSFICGGLYLIVEELGDVRPNMIEICFIGVVVCLTITAFIYFAEKVSFYFYPNEKIVKWKRTRHFIKNSSGSLDFSDIKYAVIALAAGGVTELPSYQINLVTESATIRMTQTLTMNEEPSLAYAARINTILNIKKDTKALIEDSIIEVIRTGDSAEVMAKELMRCSYEDAKKFVDVKTKEIQKMNSVLPSDDTI